MRLRAYAVVLGSVLFSLFAVAGCGRSDRVAVSGTVTWKGQPVEDGDIAFFPEPGTAGAQSSAPIQAGQYQLDGEWGLVPGVYQVRINAYRPPTDTSNMLAGGALDKPPETPGVPSREQFLPAKFNAASTLDKLTVPPDRPQIEQNYDLKP